MSTHMRAGKSPTNHLALEQWRANMQDTLTAITCNNSILQNPQETVQSIILMGWLEFLDQCQEFAGPRITPMYPAGLVGVFVRERGMLRMAERHTSGITVLPQEYIKNYYTGGERNIGEIAK
jgi:hypothetical protein